MKFLPPALLAGVAFSLASHCYCQTGKAPAKNPPRTLAQEIKAMKWDPAKSGSLLALDVDQARTSSAEPGLKPFKRKLIEVGSMSAIAPTEMVLIDDRLDQPPNLYDGLPADAKVLYLLSTLSADQLDKAAGKGIGLGDLYGEQQKVFRSLVPRHFKYESSRVNEDGIMSWPTDKKTLSDAETDKVRIRLDRELEFHLYLRDDPRSYTMHDTNEEYGQPGDTAYSRDDSDEYDRGDSFGIQRRVVQENKPKPSDIKYEAPSYDKQIVLSAMTTIDQLVKQAGAECGTEIHCDMRVGDMVVSSFGAKARAGDVLKAVALMVTGTYRKVGDTYILTSDLVGMGTRKLSLAVFENDLRQSVYEKSDEWRKLLGKNGVPAKIHFGANDPLAPNDAVLKRLEKSDASYQNERFPAQELTPNLRGFLARVNQRYKVQPVDTDSVGVQSSIHFSFVLPNGQVLHSERQELGSMTSFNPPPPFQGATPPEFKPGKLGPDSPAIPLVVSSDSASSAETAVKEAVKYGFKEVWINTRRKAVLTAAANAGKALNVSVRLVIDPWTVADEPAPNEPDRTLFGETGSAAKAHLLKTGAWRRFNLFEDGDLIDPKETVSPTSPGLASRWSAFADLARTPGISGLVFVNTQPTGYEPAVTRARTGFFDEILASHINFGYTPSLRVAFIRAKGLDPIDIAWEGWMGMSDTRQPFFLDDAQRGGSSVYDGRENPHAGMDQAMASWAAFRAKANQDAVMSLLKAIPDLPVLIELRKGAQNNPPLNNTPLFPWKPVAELPTLPAQTAYITSVVPGSYGLVRMPLESSIDPGNRRTAYVPYYFSNLEKMAQEAVKRGNHIAIDASRIPSGKLGVTLGHWFVPSESGQ